MDTKGKLLVSFMAFVLLGVGVYWTVTLTTNTESTEQSRSATVPTPETLPDTAIAFVNGVYIPKSRYKKRVDKAVSQFGDYKKLAAKISGSETNAIRNTKDIVRRTVRKQALMQLIDNVVVMTEAKKQGIEPDQKKTNKMLNMVKKRIARNDTQFRQKMQKKDVQKAWNSIRTRVMTAQLIHSFVNNNIDTKTISDTEIKQYYQKNKKKYAYPESVRLQHLHVKPNDQAQKKINEIYSLIQDGMSFTRAVKRFSQGPKAANNGHWGYVTRESLPEPVAAEAFRLRNGVISKPIETKIGYHLIKVLDHREAGPPPIDKIKSKIKNDIQEEHEKEAIKEMIEEYRKSAKIAIQVKGRMLENGAALEWLKTNNKFDKRTKKMLNSVEKIMK